MTRRRQAGFTLIELIVALALSAVVLSMAVALANGVAAISRPTVASGEADREVLAERWLRAALGSLDVGADGTVVFDGLEDQVVFRARQVTPRGWPEAVTIQLYADSGRLRARLSTGRELTLLSDVVAVRTSYLIESGTYARWSSRWSSAVMAPPALRLEISRRFAIGIRLDTLLFGVGKTG